MIITNGTRIGPGVTVKQENIPYTLPLLFELDASVYASGTTWLDQSGNNRHATIAGSPAWDSGAGGSFFFDVDSSKSITIPGSADGWGLAGTAPNATFSVWAKVTADNLLQHIAGWRGGLNFWFLMYGSQTEARLDTGVNYDIGMNYTPYFNNWAYTTFVADSAMNQTRLYINGVLVGNYDTALGTFGGAASEFTLGVTPTGGFPLSGYIGGAAAYSRALTEREVYAEFVRTKTRYGL